MPTRRNAFVSLKRLASNHDLVAQEKSQLFETLTAALSDYTTDTRGDVGSVMRIEGLKDLSQTLWKASVTPEQAQEATSLALKLALDKIDAVRQPALLALREMAQSSLVPPLLDLTDLLSL